jgi:hypothetical protein
MLKCLRTLCFALAASAALTAQQDIDTPAPTKGFTVAILQGDGLVNPLPRPPASHLSIRVNDTRGIPIRNAVAVFELPAEGASASFPDGSMVKVILTNYKGEAMVDIKSNEVPGKYQPTIMVNYLGQSSIVRLNQENTFLFREDAAAPGRRSIRKARFFSKKTLLIIGAAAVAGIATILATHRGHTPITPPPSSGITITPGTGTVGAH